MRSIETIIDNYITREDTAPCIGRCTACGDLMEGSYFTDIGESIFCSDDCIMEYYRLTKIDNMKYCTCCDYSLGEDFIEDPNGDTFCDIECFINYNR